MLLVLWPLGAAAEEGVEDLAWGVNGRVYSRVDAKASAIYGVAVQGNATLVCGDYNKSESSRGFVLGRYLGNGTLDASFGVDGWRVTDFGGQYQTADHLAVYDDGRFLATGYNQVNSTAETFCLARYLADGSPDTGFGTDGKVLVDFDDKSYDVGRFAAVQSDGRIVMVGHGKLNGRNLFQVARLNKDGSLDTSFGTGGKVSTDFPGSTQGASCYAGALQPDGKILAGGTVLEYDPVDDCGETHFALARYLADGSLDPDFGGDGRVSTDFMGGDCARALAVMPDGRILAAGEAAQRKFAMAMYLANGTLDETFADKGKFTHDFSLGSANLESCLSVSLQPDGKIIGAGYVGQDFAMLRLYANGTLDDTFGPNGTVVLDMGQGAMCRATAVRSDGRILAAGSAVPPGWYSLAQALPEPQPSLQGLFLRFFASLGERLAGTRAWAATADHAFATARLIGRDTTPPGLSAASPGNGAVDVAVNTAVTATFDDAMDADSLGTASFFLTGPGNAAVPASVAYDPGSRTATLTPTADLDHGSTYTASLATTVKDRAGNALGAVSWSFATGAKADAEAPTVTRTDPADGDTGVSTAASLTAVFNEPMDPATLTASAFTLADAAGAQVSGNVVYDAANKAARFTPGADLAAGSSYTATLGTGAKDAAGNALARAVSFTFATAESRDETPPRVERVEPVDGAVGVAVSASVSAVFSEDMDSSSLSASTFQLADSAGTAVSGQVSYEAGSRLAKFAPQNALSPSTAYTAKLLTGAADASGNPLAQAESWTFTTGALPDSEAPELALRLPGDGETGVPVNVGVRLVFNEALDPDALGANAFALADASGSAVAGSLSWTAATRTLVFTPAADLGPATAYTATAGTGLRDEAGNSLAANSSWSFTTGAGADGSAPEIVSRRPEPGAVNVPGRAVAMVVFGEDMDGESLTTDTFTLKAGETGVNGSVEYEPAMKRAVFMPDAPLPGSTVLTAALGVGIKDAAGNALARKTSWSFTTEAAGTDSDGDGVPDSQDATPTDGACASPESVTGTGRITLDVRGLPGCALANVTATAPGASTLNQANRPVNLDFTDGLISFASTGLVPGSTVRVELEFPSGVPDGARIYKAGPDGFYDYTVNCTVNGSLVVVNLTDGGAGDADGTADGTILDPVGLAAPVASGSSASAGGASSSGGGCLVAPRAGFGLEWVLFMVVVVGGWVGGRRRG